MPGLQKKRSRADHGPKRSRNRGIPPADPAESSSAESEPAGSTRTPCHEIHAQPAAGALRPMSVETGLAPSFPPGADAGPRDRSCARLGAVAGGAGAGRKDRRLRDPACARARRLRRRLPARQISLDRQVALKVTLWQGSEGRKMAQLEHEHIVQVFSERVDLADTAALVHAIRAGADAESGPG